MDDFFAELPQAGSVGLLRTACWAEAGAEATQVDVDACVSSATQCVRNWANEYGFSTVADCVLAQFFQEN